MPELRVFDTQKRWIGVLQNAQSVQWLENYKLPDEVKIVAADTPENRSILLCGHRIYNTENAACAIIMQLEHSVDSLQSTLTIRAKGAEQLLDARVVMASEVTQNVEAGIYSLYTRNRRGLPIETAPLQGFADTLPAAETTFGSVLSGITELCSASSLGFKVVFCPTTKTDTLTVYQGQNRTARQNSNYRGFLSTDNGTLQNVQLINSSPSYKNVAVVAGREQNGEREVVLAMLQSGLSADLWRELFVNCEQLGPTYRTATETLDANGLPTYSYTTATYTPQQYQDALHTEGLKALAQHNSALQLSCTAAQKNILYGVHYFLGDRMPIKIPQLGMLGSAIILQAKRVYQPGEHTTHITLSDFEFEEA